MKQQIEIRAETLLGTNTRISFFELMNKIHIASRNAENEGFTDLHIKLTDNIFESYLELRGSREETDYEELDRIDRERKNALRIAKNARRRERVRLGKEENLKMQHAALALFSGKF